MADKTKIVWTDATWNPVTGCTKVSQGCKHCYAERDWARLVHMPAFSGRAFTDVACHPERLDQPLHWKKPRRIFVNSMSDLFHEDVPDEFIDQVFAVMAQSPQHTFQVLTKRPERMREYMNHPVRLNMWADAEIPLVSSEWGDFPLPNVWLGVSVEDQATAYERIPLLLQTPAAVRWISAEPLLGPVDLRYFNYNYLDKLPKGVISLDWVVVGGESGPKARPMHPDWARSLRDQCQAAGVSFLFKQWGEWAAASTLPPTTLLPSSRWAWISIKGGEADSWMDVMHEKPLSDEGAHHELMGRIGKSAAGRLLDGDLHDGYPV